MTRLVERAAARPVDDRASHGGHGRRRPGSAGRGAAAGSGRRTCATRCGTLGYAIDTLETATDWTPPAGPRRRRRAGAPPRPRGRRRAGPRVQPPVARLPERLERCTRPTSSASSSDPDETLERWRRAQDGGEPARSSSTAGRSATSTGSARDHAPYLAAEKGELGMAALEATSPGRFDPGRPCWQPAASCSTDETADDGADQILAIDVGTQSVRALVFDPRGELVAGARIPIEPYVSPQPGWAEQDPELYWRALGEACRRVLGRPGASRRDAIAGVALTTQRGTVVVTDADRRRRSGPAIVWLDQRRTEGLPADRRRRRGSPSGRSACARPSAAFQADCEANWIRANEPDIWARIAPLPPPVRLPHPPPDRSVRGLDRRARSATCRSTTSACAGPRTATGSGPPPRSSPAWLPELVPPTGRLGELTAGGRRGDRAARPARRSSRRPPTRPARSSARARSTPDIGALSYGTTATINTTQRRYVEAIPLVPPYPAAVPGAYSARDPGLPRLLDGRVVQARVRRPRGRPGGRARGSSAEALFDELVRPTAPGSMGLIAPAVLVARACGSRAPRRRARSSASATSTPGPTSTGRSSRASPTPCARAASGPQAGRRCRSPSCASPAAASQSPAAVQLTADVFGLPVGRPAHPRDVRPRRGDRRGASGSGCIRRSRPPSAEMTRLARTASRTRPRHALYDELYRRVYRRMYDRLQPLYEEIRRSRATRRAEVRRARRRRPARAASSAGRRA